MMKKSVIAVGITAALGAALFYPQDDGKSHGDKLLNMAKKSATQAMIENAGADIGPDKSMRASDDPQRDERAKEELGYSLGMQAYLYGIPSLRLEEFRYGFNQLSELAKKNKPGFLSAAADDGVQYNELIHTRFLSTSEAKVGLTPNNDTMYSPAFYNLKDEPVVFTVPEIRDRYYSIQIVDAYVSNVAYIGTRATHSEPGDYLLIGPDWQGEVPENMTPVRMETNEGFLSIRIVVDGESDRSNVTVLQDQFQLLPLSAHQSGTSVVELSEFPKPNKEGELSRYRRIVELAQHNPPLDPRTKAMWDSFQYLGMSLDKPFEPSKLDPAIKRGMKRAISATHDVIAWKVKYRGYKSESMWNVDPRGGSYAQDFLARAEGSIQGLVVHDPEEAMYFHTYHDGNRDQLHGDKQYTLHFDADYLPQVDAFWSITAYNDEYNLVDNPINRYSIGDRTEGLKYNDDGSLTLHIQSTLPAEGQSNWLPTPAGEIFRLNFRMYMPKPVIRDTSTVEAYLPPLVARGNPEY